MATLINGDGNGAVYAAQDADWFAGVEGNATKRLNIGLKMAYEIEDANTIAVKDGVIVTKEGRRIQIDAGAIDEFIIPTGSQGVTRYFIIGYHLYTDASSNQLCETFVQLMASASDTIPENTFRGGSTEVYVSLYRVTQNGLTLDTIQSLLPERTTIDAVKSEIDTANKMDNIVDCSTARNVAAKTVSLSGFVLRNSAKVVVRFTNTGTTNPSSGNLTLNVNNTGAKNIIDGHTNNTTMTYSNAGNFCNNQVCEFIYNGTAWVWLNRDSNTTYTGGTLKTAAAKTGSGSTVTNTIAANTTIDNAIGTLLNNDYKINSDLTGLEDWTQNHLTRIGKSGNILIGRYILSVSPDGQSSYSGWVTVHVNVTSLGFTSIWSARTINFGGILEGTTKLRMNGNALEFNQTATSASGAVPTLIEIIGSIAS